MLPGLFLLSSVLLGEAPTVPDLYQRVSRSVVGITCERKPREKYTGTGTIIDPKGLVLTSTTVVPRDATDIRVYLKGGQVVRAKSVLADGAKELSLIQVEPREDGVPFDFARLGDSRSLRLGAPALTLGNAFLSIENDDQVCLGEGVISGFYELTDTFSESKYRGNAIETTAHVNDGMDGGPLLDGAGELVGVISLNYSRARWLGTAVPIDELKPVIAAARGWLSDRDEDFPAYAGLEVEEVGGSEVRILRAFAGSPAAGAALSGGERITRAQDTAVQSIRDLREVLRRCRPGDSLRLEIEKDRLTRTADLRLWGRF